MGGRKGKESLTSRTLTTGKMVMPPPEMEKMEKIREGENQVLCWSSLFEISGRH